MARPDTKKPAPDSAGASEPEPSLARRMAESATDERPIDPMASGTEPVADADETGLTERLREGDESAPRSGRVDAAGATYGRDPDRARISKASAGGPVTSVGGAVSQSDDESTAANPARPGTPRDAV